MRVPVVNLPTVYHVGTLDPAHRGRQWASSHEGAGLSVSLCPAAWERIARLGGKPWQELTRHDALFLDLGAMDDALLAEIQGWAREADLLEPRLMWRAWRWDDESERWGYMLFGSMDEAVLNLPDEPEENEDIVSWFAAAHPTFRRAAPPASWRHGPLAEVLAADGALRTTPERHGLDGFYAAAFERRG